MPIGAPHEALLVVDRAVGTNQGQKYVLVVNDENEVEYRAVEVRPAARRPPRSAAVSHDHRARTATGRTSRSRSRCSSPTDRIIVEGLQRVRPGAKVNPQLVDMLTMLIEKPAGMAAPTEKPATEPKSEQSTAETAAPK